MNISTKKKKTRQGAARRERSHPTKLSRALARGSVAAMSVEKDSVNVSDAAERKAAVIKDDLYTCVVL